MKAGTGGGIRIFAARYFFIPLPFLFRRNRRRISFRFFNLVLLLLATALPGLMVPIAPAWCGEANAFVFHRFGEPRYPSTNTPPEIFEQQLQLLQRENFEILTLGEVARRIAAGRSLPEKCAVLTIDDGYSSFWDHAWPILKEYGFPATLFVSTQAVGKHGYMNWDQLRQLAENGIEIGNHTVTHPYLVNHRPGESETFRRKRVRQEIQGAQKVFVKRLGKAPELFAYPFGEYDPEILNEVRAAGFTGAAGQQSGVIASSSDRFLLPRFPMGGPYGTLEGFTEKLRMKALPIEILSPETPLLGENNPPVLTFRLRSEEIDLRHLRCFVSGLPDGIITPDPDQPNVFHAVGSHPLSGRRSKYTLTAPGLRDGRWYWFSQLWIDPSRGED